MFKSFIVLIGKRTRDDDKPLFSCERMEKMRKPTSINIDKELYKKLGIDLLKRGVSYSDWFEDMIRHWLAKHETPVPTSAEREVIAALRDLAKRDSSALQLLPIALGIEAEVFEQFVYEASDLSDGRDSVHVNRRPGERA